MGDSLQRADMEGMAHMIAALVNKADPTMDVEITWSNWNLDVDWLGIEAGRQKLVIRSKPSDITARHPSRATSVEDWVPGEVMD